MFDRFTRCAKHSLREARLAAIRLGTVAIDREHLLLGVLAAGGVAAEVLATLHVEAEDLRQGVAGRVRDAPLAEAPVDMPFRRRAKGVLERAMLEAQQLGHQWCGSEHLLIALAGDSDGVAASVLRAVGLTSGVVRARTLAVLQSRLRDHERSWASQGAPPPAPDPPAPEEEDDEAIPPLPPWLADAVAGFGVSGVFSAAAVAVLDEARQRAALQQHSHIGAEHVLFGLFERDHSVWQLCERLGTARERVAERVAAALERLQLPTLAGESQPVDRPFGGEARGALQLAMIAAGGFVAPLHLLFGLVCSGETEVARVLHDEFGITREVVTALVRGL